MDVLTLPGVQLGHEVRGRGPAVVLVHGFGLDSRMWEPQIGALADRHRVVRYDCRGFGVSAMDPEVAYTHAGDLVALLDHLGIERAMVVGLSFGGRVALQAALAAPDRVRALVLLDAVLDGVPWDAESAQALGELDRAVATGGVPAGRERWLAHPLFAAAADQHEVAAALARMVADYPGQHWLGLDPHAPVPPVIDRLAEVVAPTLVVVGERDVPGFRAMAAELARGIPQARLETVAGAGHMVSMEAPDRVNALIVEHLAAL